MQVIRAKVLVDDAGYITLYRPPDNEEIARLKSEIAFIKEQHHKEVSRLKDAVCRANAVPIKVLGEADEPMNRADAEISRLKEALHWANARIDTQRYRAVRAEARADKAEAEIRRIHEAVSKRLNDNAAALKADLNRLLRWTKRG